MAGRPETKQYLMDQLSEYWDSGFTIPEYCELKELSYESARRWISQLKKERRRRSANSGQEKMFRFPNLENSSSKAVILHCSESSDLEIDLAEMDKMKIRISFSIPSMEAVTPSPPTEKRICPSSSSSMFTGTAVRGRR